MLPVYYIGMIFDKIYNLPYNSTIKIGENSLSLLHVHDFILIYLKKIIKFLKETSLTYIQRKNAYIKNTFQLCTRFPLKELIVFWPMSDTWQH